MIVVLGLTSTVSIAILSLIFSMLIREFMALLGRRNPTPPIAALGEFLVDEQVRRMFWYSDSFPISFFCIIWCSCLHITSIWNFEVRVPSSSFLESFSTKQVLKVLIKKDISFNKFISFPLCSIKTGTFAWIN